MSIQNSNDDVLYTLPKTVGPPGYVVAAGSDGNVIFTNSPLPEGPYLTNPLNSVLTMAGYDIVGAGHIRPNSLEVATTSILPIINGVTTFTDALKVNTIRATTGNIVDIDGYLRGSNIIFKVFPYRVQMTS